MKKCIYLIAMVISFSIVGCTSKQTPNITDKQRAEIEKEVSGQWELFLKAVEKADANEFCTFLSDQFIAMYSQGHSFAGRQTYCDSVKSWFAGRNSCEISNKIVKFNVLSKRYVMVDQESDFKVILKDNTEESIHHTVSMLFSKEETAWKIIHGHESWK